MNSAKVLTPSQLQLKAVREAVANKKRKEAQKGSESEEEYEEYYDEEGETVNSFDKDEEDYLEFLEEWGHVDFALLTYLPHIRTVEELYDMRNKDMMNTTRVIRTQTLIASNPIRPTKKDKRQKKNDEDKKKSQGKNGKQETLYEKQYLKKEDNLVNQNENDELTLGLAGDQEELAEKLGPIKAERFDFTMNEQFYSINIVVDEFGERLTANTSQQGRIISKDGIHHEEPSMESSEEEAWDDDKQEYVPIPKPVIPLEELIHVYYFQWRLDKLEEGQFNPKVCIGVCRDKFQVGCDLSRQKELYCINMASGDKFSDRRWKDYYNLDGDFGPRYGHFVEGTVLGVFIDMDRGIINFFKDGMDLGQAFVQQELKYGTLYPFVQVQQVCELSIFHPFVYPAYRPPLPDDEQNAHDNMQETPGELNNTTLQEGIQVYQGDSLDIEEEKNDGPFVRNQIAGMVGMLGRATSAASQNLSANLSASKSEKESGWFSKTVKGITAAGQGLAAAGTGLLTGRSDEGRSRSQSPTPDERNNRREDRDNRRSQTEGKKGWGPMGAVGGKEYDTVHEESPEAEQTFQKNEDTFHQDQDQNDWNDSRNGSNRSNRNRNDTGIRTNDNRHEGGNSTKGGVVMSSQRDQRSERNPGSGVNRNRDKENRSKDNEREQRIGPTRERNNRDSRNDDRNDTRQNQKDRNGSSDKNRRYGGGHSKNGSQYQEQERDYDDDQFDLQQAEEQDALRSKVKSQTRSERSHSGDKSTKTKSIVKQESNRDKQSRDKGSSRKSNKSFGSNNYAAAVPGRKNSSNQSQQSRRSFKEEDENLRKNEYDSNYDKAKKQVLKDMKATEANMSLNQERKSVKINNVDVNLDELDMRKLTKEQNQDIQEIERLQQEVQNLTGNLTLGNVSEIDRNFSMRPTVMTNSSQQRQINGLQYEIEKYQKEIELLKLKLQFKHQIISYKQMEKQRQQNNQINYQEEPCVIF